MKDKQNIAIIGSTGSIGTQALEVIKENKNIFNVLVLSGNRNSDLLVKQSILFSPKYVVVSNEEAYKKVSYELKKHKIKVLFGEQGLCEAVSLKELDVLYLTSSINEAKS